MNQRKLFQEQARLASPTRPAAAIGVTTASIISAALRGDHHQQRRDRGEPENRPISPSTVATSPSVMSSTLNDCRGCPADQVVTFNRLSISADSASAGDHNGDTQPDPARPHHQELTQPKQHQRQGLGVAADRRQPELDHQHDYHQRPASQNVVQ